MNHNPSPALTLQQTAYNTLTTFFTTHIDHVAEISILPPAIEPEDGISMQDGPNLGVPKKILALAFLEARARFFKGVKEDGVASESALTATHTILLFDPEHLTAANHRKRHLLHHHSHTLPLLLHRELTFTTTILTSPLHRQSKSPTLWHHRYWLLTTFLVPLSSPTPNLPPPPSPSVPTPTTTTTTSSSLSEFLKNELTTILQSSTRHPKNYHAFNYGRKLLSHLITYTHHHHPSSPSSTTTTNSPPLTTTTLLPLLKKHCTHTPNASDISAWSFFIFMVRLSSSSSLTSTTTSSSSEQQDEIVLETLKSILQLRFSTLAPYLFVREAVGAVVVGEEARREVGRLVGEVVERAVVGKGRRGEDGGDDGRVTFEERVRVLAGWLEEEEEEEGKRGEVLMSE